MVSSAVFPSTITPPMTHLSIESLPMIIPSTITPPITGPQMVGGQIPGSLAQTPRPEVLYEIHLHPTYQIPTLWFTLNYLPEHEEPWNFVTVCKYLMSEYEYKKLQSSESPLRISMSVSYLSCGAFSTAVVKLICSYLATSYY
jgi:Autophagocytosis associated protein, active-site domain